MTKVCTSCGLDLPLRQFSLVHGKPRSRCKDCLRIESNADRARFKSRLKADTHLSNARQRRVEPNPLIFSRSVCEHVGDYVDRAIRRWEGTTEKEAPPYLTALKQVAEGFVREHPEPQCARCGKTLLDRRRRVCDECRAAAKRRGNEAYKRRERARKNRQQGWLLIAQAEADLIRLFRELGLGWKEIAERFGMSVGGVFAKANYDVKTGGEPPPSYYKHGLVRKTDRIHATTRRGASRSHAYGRGRIDCEHDPPHHHGIS